MAPPASANILVVDDVVENLRLLSNVLGEHGFEVRPATSGRQALEAARRAPPDLILLDVNMPEMNGYEVCAQLKSSDALKDIPVIFLTALGETSDKITAFNAGGADYITKPFQVEEVLARVRVHLGLRQARTELAQSYDKLRVLEKMRDDLVQMLVHDMRSPLSALIYTLDFLREDLGGSLNAQSAGDLQMAITAAGNVVRMAEDMLDVSRLEEGKLPLVRQPTEVVKIAEAVRAALAGMERGRIIEVDAGAPVQCVCDGNVVRRVLENLVSNAIKHTPSGGQIRISVSAAGSRVRFAVQDSGDGVPPEARAKLFEKFGSVAVRKDRTYHSTGIGLSFCKLAVDAHGGTIGVDAGVPRGSVFWFELPV